MNRAFASRFAAPAVAGGLAIAIWASPWRGVDVPAQVYRVDLFRDYGWLLWDSRWYSGHYLLPYSVLFPPFGALLGIFGAAIIGAVTASWAFDQLVRTTTARNSVVPSLLFAVGTAVPVAIGQFPFLCGEAIGLLCVCAVRTRKPRAAVVSACLCPLFSPVAGAFLVLALTALAMGDSRTRRWFVLMLAGMSALPLVALNAVFYEPGSFPFWGTDLAVVLALCAVAFFVIPRDAHVLRIGTVLYAFASAALFAVPNALGGNFVRLASAVAPALGLAWCWAPGRRRILALTVLPLVFWQVAPAWGVIQSVNDDPSASTAYFQPLIDFVATQPTTGRVEIPFTLAHWEAAQVAVHVSLARGWERQTDRADNPIFYRPETLSAHAYKEWLYRTGVQWVALPDVPLDYSAKQEAALLRHPPQYLRLVWTDRHWRVWQVDGSPGIITGPAHVVSINPDHITIDASRPGTSTLRIRYTSTWSISSGKACVRASPGGWTRVTFPAAGRITLTATLFGDPGHCRP